MPSSIGGKPRASAPLRAQHMLRRDEIHVLGENAIAVAALRAFGRQLVVARPKLEINMKPC
jgi:hypothetical protein